MMTSTSTGTGDYALGSAVTGYESFATAGFANNDTAFFRAEEVDSNGVPSGGFEEFFGTYNTTGPALARTSIIKSSNSDAAVSWGAGTKRIYTINPTFAHLWGEVSPAQLTANQNDWNPWHIEAAVIRFTTDASRNITGLAGGYHGRIGILHNVGSQNAVLVDEDAGSSAGNRFALPGNFTIAPDGLAVLQYDNITARWRSLIPPSMTIGDLTTDDAPDIAADYIPYWDASASTTDKVLLRALRNALLGAGSASAGSWPFLVAGTLLTTPEAGALELDANCLYGTTDAGNRGVIPIEHIIRADSAETLTSTTSAQAIFDSPTNGQITLETGVYEFEALLALTGMSATSGNATFDFGGTATMGSFLWFGYGRDAAADAATGTLAGSHSVDATLVAAPLVTAATTTAAFFRLKGTFEVTAGGTVIPRILLQTAAAATVVAGSFFKIRRMGSTSMVSVGQWD